MSRADGESRHRLLGISKCTSVAIRRRNLPGVTKAGCAPIIAIIDLKPLRDRRTNLGAIRAIVNGGGGNQEFRIDLRRAGKSSAFCKDIQPGAVSAPTALLLLRI